MEGRGVEGFGLSVGMGEECVRGCASLGGDSVGVWVSAHVVVHVVGRESGRDCRSCVVYEALCEAWKGSWGDWSGGSCVWMRVFGVWRLKGFMFGWVFGLERMREGCCERGEWEGARWGWGELFILCLEGLFAQCVLASWR